MVAFAPITNSPGSCQGLSTEALSGPCRDAANSSPAVASPRRSASGPLGRSPLPTRLSRGTAGIPPLVAPPAHARSCSCSCSRSVARTRPEMALLPRTTTVTPSFPCGRRALCRAPGHRFAARPGPGAIVAAPRATRPACFVQSVRVRQLSAWGTFLRRRIPANGATLDD